MPPRHSTRTRRPPERYQGDGTYISSPIESGPDNPSPPHSRSLVSSTVDLDHGKGDAIPTATMQKTENVEQGNDSLVRQPSAGERLSLLDIASPQSSSPLQSLRSSQLSSPTSLYTRPQLGTPTRKMANIKMTGLPPKRKDKNDARSRSKRANKKRQEPRRDGASDPDFEITDASPQPERALQHEQPVLQLRPKSLYRDATFESDPDRLPAAFPSEDSKPPVSQKDPGYRGRIATHELMEDRFGKNATEASKARSKKDVAMMWDCVHFPTGLSAIERAWYQQVKAMMPSRVDDESAVIMLSSLYWSMSGLLINTIHTETSDLYPLNTYLAVRKLLNVNQRNLQKIIDKNTEAFDDEVPEHLTELLARAKQKDPNATVDPDTPTMPALDRTIRYLKKNDLPASLLGEWMYYSAPGSAPTMKSAGVATSVQSGPRFGHSSGPQPATMVPNEARNGAVSSAKSPPEPNPLLATTQKMRSLADTLHSSQQVQPAEKAASAVRHQPPERPAATTTVHSALLGRPVNVLSASSASAPRRPQPQQLYASSASPQARPGTAVHSALLGRPVSLLSRPPTPAASKQTQPKAQYRPHPPSFYADTPPSCLPPHSYTYRNTSQQSTSQPARTDSPLLASTNMATANRPSRPIQEQDMALEQNIRMVMTCRCKFEFCWESLAPWGSCGLQSTGDHLESCPFRNQLVGINPTTIFGNNLEEAIRQECELTAARL
ncbi:hypothetical protein P154DRAFT_586350 [Amniculicola lignicola CBS 123094]|uniref:Uncharacterized protein n=1 Tax=Amniculicola lignicola CBS 123094 TaxID=1392246 RepID=A0A6A5X218_9PLEO|nr:hypothetical protein P154DRAFT_586350 [Amniculicola lignicola CBS 123094]